MKKPIQVGDLVRVSGEGLQVFRVDAFYDYRRRGGRTVRRYVRCREIDGGLAGAVRDFLIGGPGYESDSGLMIERRTLRPVRTPRRNRRRQDGRRTVAA